MKSNKLIIILNILTLILFLTLSGQCGPIPKNPYITERAVEKKMIEDGAVVETIVDEAVEEVEDSVIDELTDLSSENIIITVVPEKPIAGQEFEIDIGWIDYVDMEGNLHYVLYREGKLIDSYTIPPFKVTSPKEAGVYTYTIEIPEASIEIDWDIEILKLQSIILEPIPSESGFIVPDGNVNNGGIYFIGDTPSNHIVGSFVSFDIGPLIGANIYEASLGLTLFEDPSWELDNLETIENEMFGLNPPPNPTSIEIDNGNYEIGPLGRIIFHPSTLMVKNIKEFIIDGSTTSIGEEPKNILQNSLDEELDRLIFIMAPENLTSNDNDRADGFIFEVEFVIDYTLPETASIDSTQLENEDIGGIGALLTLDDDDNIIVLEPLPDSPALDAGIQEGDMIIGVDGIDLKDMDIDTVANMIMGPVNTKVAITLVRSDQLRVFICTRQPLPEIAEDE